MKIILNPDMALELNQAILAPYHPHELPTESMTPSMSNTTNRSS